MQFAPLKAVSSTACTWLMFGRSAEVGHMQLQRCLCIHIEPHYVALRSCHTLHKSPSCNAPGSPPCPLLTWSDSGCCKTACQVSCTTHFSSCKLCLLLRVDNSRAAVHSRPLLHGHCTRESSDGQLAACPMPCFLASPAGRYKLQCHPPQ